eukprot:scaffold635_cov311-Pinguiococcus_pyrenoidosus.AAC.21
MSGAIQAEVPSSAVQYSRPQHDCHCVISLSIMALTKARLTSQYDRRVSASSSRNLSAPRRAT